MRKLIFPIGAAIVGSVAGFAIAIGLVTLKRMLWPPGPMMMGDLESPVFAAIGVIIGGGLGLFVGLLATRAE